MNMGNSANACSGRALPSKTACAAAQHRSSVSVSSMAASRISGGMRFCTSILRSNGFFSFMGGPAGDGCVRTPSYASGSARQLRRLPPVAFPGWSATGGSSHLHPAGGLTAGRPRMNTPPRLERHGVGRVHFFSIFGHDRSVFFFPAVVTPKHP